MTKSISDSVEEALRDLELNYDFIKALELRNNAKN
jgi:hypothetical protein